MRFTWRQVKLTDSLYKLNKKQKEVIKVPNSDREHWLFYFNTYLLTYSLVQSPSWEANWFAASQEIPRISRNPKVHYRTHKLPPSFSILGQPNPVHIPISHLLEIQPNIIHPSTPRSPQWYLSLRFPQQEDCYYYYYYYHYLLTYLLHGAESFLRS